MQPRKLAGYLSAEELLIPATRYYLGRQTIATCAHADELAAQWGQIDPMRQSILRRDIEEAFRDDDRDRARNSIVLALGADCDRLAWEKVRKAWEASDENP